MKPGNAGFSVMEIMVALAIGGILTAMAVPNFNDMREGYRLRAATYDVFTALQRARSEAVKKNNNYRFSLVDDSTYSVHDDTDNDGVVDAGETVTQKNIAAEAQGTKMYFWCWKWTGSGWELATALTFAPDGTSGDWSYVPVINAQWEEKWIQVSPTGRIQIM